MAIFDDAKAVLENTSMLICACPTQIVCRNAVIAWITYLESLSSRRAFEEELETKTKALTYNASSFGRSCQWLKKVTKSCKDGLKIADSILFTTYLEGGNCEANLEIAIEKSQ